MSKKVIISKEGYDATSETDPDNLIFSSDYGTLKYYLNGNASIRIVGDGSDQSSTTTINHALGYVPVFLVYVNGFVNDASDYYLTPYYSSTAVVAREATAYATTSTYI